MSGFAGNNAAAGAAPVVPALPLLQLAAGPYGECTATSAAVAGTYGAYTTIAWNAGGVATLPVAIKGLLLSFSSNNYAITDVLAVLFNIGGVGAEVALFGPIIYKTFANQSAVMQVFLPLALTAGTRLSVACVNRTSATVVNFNVSAAAVI